MGITIHHRLYDTWGWGEPNGSFFKILYCKLYRKIYFPNQIYFSNRLLEYCYILKYSEMDRWCSKNCVADLWTSWNNRGHTKIGFGFKNKKEFLHFKMVWG